MPRFLRIIALVFFTFLMMWICTGLAISGALTQSPGLLSLLILGSCACCFTLGGGGK